jgi:hypothetical protein
MMHAQVAPQMAYQQQPQMMPLGGAPMQQQQFMQPAGPMPQLDGMFDCFNDMETCMCVTVGCTCCLAGQTHDRAGVFATRDYHVIRYPVSEDT